MMAEDMLDILNGAFDIHFHFSPDAMPRAQNAYDIMCEAEAAGMMGLGLKDHTGSTVAVAQTLNAAFPNGPHCFGTYTMSVANGGVNPWGVETALKAGADVVWFPTYGTRQHIDVLGRGKYPMPDDFEGYVLCDESGEILPEVIACIDLIHEYGAVMATGHWAPEESILLLKEGKKRGVRHMVLTHPSESVTPVSLALQKEAVAYGAMIEHCFLAVAPLGDASMSMADLAEQIRAVGVANCVVSSDFGKVAFGPIVAGFARYLHALQAEGFSDREMKQMIMDNPRRLLGHRL